LPDGADRGAIRTTDTGFAFVLEGAHGWAGAAELAAAVPALTEIWWVSAEGQPRPMYIRNRVPHGIGGGARTGASFIQVNSGMSTALHEEVVARVLAYHPVTVIDAYAGTGETAVSVAAQGVRVTAIEADSEAVKHCGSRLPAGSRALAARVEDALQGALPADVVLLNPPRQGVEPKVTALLSATSGTSPRAIVYVSCDPATLARDVGRLRGWRISAVEAFDMFPQTAHVETICELVPEASP
jgi:23S rRNA (uracil1939-C5)-methyltransferase